MRVEVEFHEMEGGFTLPYFRPRRWSLTVQQGLAALRVVDLSTGHPGRATARGCSPTPAPTSSRSSRRTATRGGRGRRAARPSTPTTGGALFQFLHHGMRSVVGRPGDAEVEALLDVGRRRRRRASVPSEFDAQPWLDAHPGSGGLLDHAVRPRRARTPSGRRREFIVQAESGGLVGRGSVAQVPFQAGGRTSEWLAGTFAAMAVAAAARRAQRTGRGEHIDFSIAEVMTIAASSYADYMRGAAPATRRSSAPRARSRRRRSSRPSTATSASAPTAASSSTTSCCSSSVPTSSTAIRGATRWTARSAGTSGTTSSTPGRRTTRPPRSCSWPASCASRWRRCTAARTSSTATTSSPATSSSTTPRRRSRCRVARGAWTTRTRRCRARRRGSASTPATIEPHAVAAAAVADRSRRLPLAGVRVLDLTAWWAGPIAAGVLAALGADVIHVESISRIDGMRTTGASTGMDGAWWERSAHYLCSNTNKRDLTLDLGTDDGLAMLRRLIGESDAVLENFSPRVLGNFGLEWEQIQRDQPALPPRAHAGVRAVGPVARQRGLRPDHGTGHGHGLDHRPRRRPAPHPAGARATRTRACTPRSPCIVGSRRARGHRAREPARGHDGRGRAQRRRRAGPGVRPPTATCSSATATAARTSRRRACTACRERRARGSRSRSRPTSSGEALVDALGSPDVGGRSRARRPTPAGAPATTSSTRTSAQWAADARRRRGRRAADRARRARPRRVATRARCSSTRSSRRRGFYEEIDHPVVGPPAHADAGRSGSRRSTAGCARRRRRSASTTTRSWSTTSASTTPPTSDSSTPRSSATARSASELRITSFSSCGDSLFIWPGALGSDA